MGFMGGRSMHDFGVKLAYSRGVREITDIETLQRLIPGCVSVRKTDTRLDKKGVDYIATLRRGADILIDAKTREPGAGRWWKNGAELALEIWSVMPGGKYHTPQDKAKVGWTLCETKETDFIYYTFDPSDSQEVFLLPFQHLRIAMRLNFARWERTYYRKKQDSYTWQSECLFVPVAEVLRGIDGVMRCQHADVMAYA